MRIPPPRSLILFAGGAFAVALAALVWAHYSRNQTEPLLLRLAATPSGETRGARVFEVKKIEFFDERRGWRRGITSPLTLTAPPDTTGTVERVLRMPRGTYRQMRVEFGKRFDAAAGEAPPLFSPVVTLPLTLTVREGEAAYLALTLATDASLRRTAEGEEVVVPIIAVEAREGILLSEDNAVSGGTVTLNQTFGMTPSGGMRPNYRLPATATIVRKDGVYALELDEDAIIRRFKEPAPSPAAEETDEEDADYEAPPPLAP